MTTVRAAEAIEFTYPGEDSGAASGRGRTYEVTLSRGGVEEVRVVDLDGPMEAVDVAETWRVRGLAVGAAGAMEDHAVAAAGIAIDAAAAATVDHGSFAGDSAYLDALDARKEEFVVVSVRRDGRRVPHRVLVDYGSEEEGSWSGDVEATDDEDAAFQARWACADILDRCEGVPGALVADRVDGMALRIIEQGPRGVTVEDLAERVMGLASARLAGGDLDGLLVGLVAMASRATQVRPSA